MARIVNETAGIICVDVPVEERRRIDPIESLFEGVDFTGPLGADAMFRFLAMDRMSERIAQAEVVSARRDAQRRARQTVDLYPAFQGETAPALVNEVDDVLWERIRKMPVIARKLDERALRIV